MNRESPYPLQRLIGVLFIIGGLWHAAAPWIFGYSSIRSAVISDVVSGLALATVGIGIVAVKGATWLNWVAAAIGVWVLASPQLLGHAGPRMTTLEATWGGPITIVLGVLAAFERYSGRITGARHTELGEMGEGRPVTA